MEHDLNVMGMVRCSSNRFESTQGEQEIMVILQSQCGITPKFVALQALNRIEITIMGFLLFVLNP
jgi:hypothetical protein